MYFFPTPLRQLVSVSFCCLHGLCPRAIDGTDCCSKEIHKAAPPCIPPPRWTWQLCDTHSGGCQHPFFRLRLLFESLFSCVCGISFPDFFITSNCSPSLVAPGETSPSPSQPVTLPARKDGLPQRIWKVDEASPSNQGVPVQSRIRMWSRCGQLFVVFFTAQRHLAPV